MERVCLLVMLAGCGRCGSSAPKAVDAAIVTEAPAPLRSKGCGKKLTLTEHMSIGDRTYLSSMPTSYDPNVAYPLVLVFHGSDASGAVVRAQLDLERGGAAVFAYPDGAAQGWTLTRDGRDVAFVSDVVSAVEDAVCIDRRAVFAVGFSYGGWMANALACARPGLLRGVVSIAGGGPNVPCDTRVAAMIVHGSNDFNEPFSSGEATRDHWLTANGCSKKTHTERPCVAYEGCAAPVRFCRHEGAHDVPDFASHQTWSFIEATSR